MSDQHKNDPQHAQQAAQTAQSGQSAPQAKVGDKVHYTGPDGRTHEATVEKVEGEHLDLLARVDGNQQKVTAVPHSADRTAHTWDHHSGGNQGQSQYTLPGQGSL